MEYLRYISLDTREDTLHSSDRPIIRDDGDSYQRSRGRLLPSIEYEGKGFGKNLQYSSRLEESGINRGGS